MQPSIIVQLVQQNWHIPTSIAYKRTYRLDPTTQQPHLLNKIYLLNKTHLFNSRSRHSLSLASARSLAISSNSQYPLKLSHLDSALKSLIWRVSCLIVKYMSRVSRKSNSISSRKNITTKVQTQGLQSLLTKSDITTTQITQYTSVSRFIRYLVLSGSLRVMSPQRQPIMIVQRQAGMANSTATSACPPGRWKQISDRKVMLCWMFTMNRHSFSMRFGLAVLAMLYIGKKSLQFMYIFWIRSSSADSGCSLSVLCLMPWYEAASSSLGILRLKAFLSTKSTRKQRGTRMKYMVKITRIQMKLSLQIRFSILEEKQISPAGLPILAVTKYAHWLELVELITLLMVRKPQESELAVRDVLMLFACTKQLWQDYRNPIFFIFRVTLLETFRLPKNMYTQPVIALIEEIVLLNKTNTTEC